MLALLLQSALELDTLSLSGSETEWAQLNPPWPFVRAPSVVPNLSGADSNARLHLAQRR